MLWLCTLINGERKDAYLVQGETYRLSAQALDPAQGLPVQFVREGTNIGQPVNTDVTGSASYPEALIVPAPGPGVWGDRIKLDSTTPGYGSDGRTLYICTMRIQAEASQPLPAPALVNEEVVSQVTVKCYKTPAKSNPPDGKPYEFPNPTSFRWEVVSVWFRSERPPISDWWWDKTCHPDNWTEKQGWNQNDPNFDKLKLTSWGPVDNQPTTTLKVKPDAAGFWMVRLKSIATFKDPLNQQVTTEAFTTIQLAATNWRVKFTKVSSRQLANADANFLPGSVGWAMDNKPYIFLGARTDPNPPNQNASNMSVFVHAEFNVEPDNMPAEEKAKLAFALSDSPAESSEAWNWSRITSRANGNAVELRRAFSLNTTQASDLRIIWGQHVGDGTLATSEVIDDGEATKFPLRAISKECYNARSGDLFWFAKWSGWRYRTAANFLFCFAADVAPAASRETRQEPIVPNEKYLTHNVGVEWKQANHTVNLYVFGIDSAVNQKIREQPEYSAVIRSYFDARKNQVRQDAQAFFQQNPTATEFAKTLQDAETFVIQDFDNGDLHLAIARCEMTIERAEVTITKANGALKSSRVKVLVGKIRDLYDFDYDTAYPAPKAAAVQAGWPTCVNQDNQVNHPGGRVFKIEVELNNCVDDLSYDWGMLGQ